MGNDGLSPAPVTNISAPMATASSCAGASAIVISAAIENGVAISATRL
jgi:hypothetical protein